MKKKKFDKIKKKHIKILSLSITIFLILSNYILCSSDDEQPSIPSTSIIESSSTNKLDTVYDIAFNEFELESTVLDQSIDELLFPIKITLKNNIGKLTIKPEKPIIIGFYLYKYDVFNTKDIDNIYFFGRNSVGNLNEQDLNPDNPLELDIKNGVIYDRYSFPNGEYWIYAIIDEGINFNTGNNYPDDINLQNNIIRSDKKITVTNGNEIDKATYIITKSTDYLTDTFIILFSNNITKRAGEYGEANLKWFKPEDYQSYIYGVREYMLSMYSPQQSDDITKGFNYNTILKKFLPAGKYYIRCQISPDSKAKTENNEVKPKLNGEYTIRISSNDDYEKMEGTYKIKKTKNNLLLYKDYSSVIDYSIIELFINDTDNKYEIGNFFPNNETIHWYTFKVD